MIAVPPLYPYYSSSYHSHRSGGISSSSSVMLPTMSFEAARTIVDAAIPPQRFPTKTLFDRFRDIMLEDAIRRNDQETIDHIGVLAIESWKCLRHVNSFLLQCLFEPGYTMEDDDNKVPAIYKYKKLAMDKEVQEAEAYQQELLEFCQSFQGAAHSYLWYMTRRVEDSSSITPSKESLKAAIRLVKVKTSVWHPSVPKSFRGTLSRAKQKLVELEADQREVHHMLAGIKKVLFQDEINDGHAATTTMMVWTESSIPSSQDIRRVTAI